MLVITEDAMLPKIEEEGDGRDEYDECDGCDGGDGAKETITFAAAGGLLLSGLLSGLLLLLATAPITSAGTSYVYMFP